MQIDKSIELSVSQSSPILPTPNPHPFPAPWNTFCHWGRSGPAQLTTGHAAPEKQIHMKATFNSAVPQLWNHP